MRKNVGNTKARKKRREKSCKWVGGHLDGAVSNSPHSYKCLPYKFATTLVGGAAARNLNQEGLQMYLLIYIKMVMHGGGGS